MKGMLLRNGLAHLLVLLFISVSGIAQVATWNVSTMPGGAGNFGPNPQAPTTTDANATVTGLTRASGVLTANSGAARGWGGHGWAATSAAGITGNQFITFTVKANTGFALSLSNFNPFDYRRSASGPPNALLQYQINSGTFVDITTINFPVSASSGGAAGPVDLSAIPALQNVPATDVVTFRLIPYGATGTSGTFYIFDFGVSTASDLTLNGTLTPVATCTTPGTPSCVIPAPVCEGNSVTIVGAGSSPAATTYTYWTAATGGTQITAGVTGNDLTTSNALTAGTYLFYVQGEDGTCVSAARQTVNVEIVTPPTATLSGGGTTCSNVPAADMQVAFTGTGPWTFTYTDGTTPVTITGTINNPYTISNAPAGTYSLVNVSSACAGTVSGSATITINTAPAIVASTSQTPICEGVSVTLSATGGINHTWQPGALSGAPTVSPTTTTVYTVTGSDAINSCTSTSTIEVVVNPIPNTSGYGGVATGFICSGGTVNLDYYPSSPYVGSWYDAPVGGNYYGNSQFVSFPLFAQFSWGGGYTWYLELSDPVTGCINPNRLNIGFTQIEPVPTVTVSGGGVVCPGGTAPSIIVQFTGSSVGNFEGTLSDGTNSYPVVTLSGYYELINPAPGTYTMVGSIYNGSCYGSSSSSGSATVSLGSPGPTITASANPTSVCLGDMLTLTASGATTYSWSDGTTNPSNGVAFAPPSTAIYTVTATDPGSCPTTATVSITVNTAPNPVPTHDTVCAPGGIVNLAATGTNVIWYDAITGGNIVASGNSYSPTISANTSFYVENSTQVFSTTQAVSMPPQTSIFTGNSRGYYFVAPVDFEITSLQVPTTASSGNQNIAVVKFNGNIAPPLYSASTNAFTILYLTQNNTTAGNIPVNITIHAGEVIGILGDRSGANSYSNTGNTITIAGNTVSLTRMGMQFPLNTTSPQNLWAETASANISRVEFEYHYLISGCVSNPRVPVNGVVSPLSTNNLVLPTSTGLCQTNSVAGSSVTFTNGNCEYLANVNGVALGSTEVCVSFGSNQNWNGEPYANRIYTIVPTTNGPGNVCLYYTAADLLSAGITNNAEICITKVSGNGVLGGPGAVEEIPNSLMTITNLSGGNIEVCFPVTGFSSFYCHSCNPGNVPLSVSVTSFVGEKQGDLDQLTWTSSSERNHSFYTIKHSNDGTHFTSIGQVNTKAPQGNSDVQLNYSFTNTKPAQGHNYYALEMTDIEQHTVRYSQVIDLFRSTNGTTVSLYPNPASTQFELNVSVSKAQHHAITLRDMSGRVVRQIQVQSQLGDNHFSVDVSDLAEGIYSVQLTGNAEILFTGKLRKVAQQQD